MSYQYTDDPVADFGAWDEEQERKLEKLPVCDYCNERIDEDYYFDIDGEFYHEECLCKQFRKSTEDYIE